MSLNADTLLDRIRLKRQLKRWQIIAIAALLVALFVIFEKTTHFSPIKYDYIARITVDDEISDDRNISKLIETVRDDTHARAVLVWLDTPGGSAVGGEQIYLDLMDLAKHKPVVAVMRTLATSAGYLASLGADHIVAREGTITGSIGVLLESFEATELAEKIGIKPIVVKSGPFKASPNPLEKYTPEQEKVLQVVIKGFYDWFVDIVAKRRHLPREKVIELADGRIYTGRQALNANLIDELGGDDEAVEWLEKTKKIASGLDIKDVRIEKETLSIYDIISQMANGKIGAHVLQKLDGLMAIWQPNSL